MLEFFRQGGQAGKISEKVHRKSVQMGPALVVISALTQERAEALVNICHRSGERKKLEAYMAALHDTSQNRGQQAAETPIHIKTEFEKGAKPCC